MDEISVSPAEKPAKKTNAIDFLTQLISQSKNVEPPTFAAETKNPEPNEEKQDWPAWKQNEPRPPGPPQHPGPPPLMGIHLEGPRAPRPPMMGQQQGPPIRPDGQGPQFGPGQNFNLPPPPRPPNLSPPRPPSHALTTPDRPPWGPRPPFRPQNPDQPAFDQNAPPPPRPPFPPSLTAPPRPPFLEPFSSPQGPSGPPNPPVSSPLQKPPFPAVSQAQSPVGPPKEKDPLAEVQEEFIQKLKRRSSVSEAEPPKRTKSEEEEEKPAEEANDKAEKPHAPTDEYRDPRRPCQPDPKYDPGHRGPPNWERGPPPGPWGGRGPPPPDAFMSERDRWAYEMARQQFIKDMYPGRHPPHGRRPVSNSHDGRHYPRH
jgi:hypothetical protein